jgi:GT2 family glycosyltransferase
MNPDPVISVIIANLNGEKYLADCLNSLADQTFRAFEVILVDNGSTDRSLDLLKKDFPWVKVICLEKNSGFAKANNIGIGASSAEYIATLNNDTIADHHWLSELHRAAESDKMVGMVASKIFLGREGKELDSAGMLLYPDGMSRQNGRGEQDSGQFDAIREVLFPSACAALYRREMLNETGCFDEDFFSYCEDTDLGLRARLAGWSAVFAPQAKIRHLYSQTSGRYSEFKAYHVERNHFWVLLKNLPLSYVLLFPFYTLWRYIIQAYGFFTGQGSVARFAEKTGPWKMLKLVLRSYGAAFRNFSAMMKKRRHIKRSRRIGRKEYNAMLKRHRISAGELMLRD